MFAGFSKVRLSFYEEKNEWDIKKYMHACKVSPVSYLNYYTKYTVK